MRVAGRRVEGSLPSLSILIDSITLAEVKLFSILLQMDWNNSHKRVSKNPIFDMIRCPEV
jgi:hypothetical protein